MQPQEQDGILCLTNARACFRLDAHTGQYNIERSDLGRRVITGACAEVAWQRSDGLRCSIGTDLTCFRGWEPLPDREGEGGFVARWVSPDEQVGIALRVRSRAQEPAFVLTVSLENRAQDTLHTLRLTPLMVDPFRNGALDLGGRLNRWRFFRQDGEHEDVRPWMLVNEMYQRRAFAANDAASIYVPEQGGGALTVGFVEMWRQAGRVQLRIDEQTHRFATLEVFKDPETCPLAPGESLSSEPLLVDAVRPAPDALTAYARAAATAQRAAPWPVRVTGWSDWDYNVGKATEETILANAQWLAKHRDRFPVDYIQIDHGFEVAEGDWLRWRPDTYAHGPAWMVEEIRKLDFRPALWVVPFMIASESEVGRNHPDWLVRDAQGELVTIPGYASGRVHALDCTHPEALEWLREMTREIVDSGFDYIKIDGANRIGAVRGVRDDPKATTIEAYHRGMQAVRAGAGDRPVMGGLFGPCLGLVNAMRVANDVGARWDWSNIDVHSGARDRYLGSGYILRCIMAALNTAYIHGRWWANDPDYLIVRDDRSELTLDEARTWLTVVALSGGSVVLGDNLPTLSAERQAVLEKAFPVHQQAAEPVDFLEAEIPRILNLPLRTDWGAWNVVALVNYADVPADLEAPLTRLGLDARGTYVAWDFWERSFAGELSEVLRREAVRPHAVSLLAVRPAEGAPQLLSTDMHLTQGAMDVETAAFDTARNTLQVALRAPGTKQGTVFVHVPEAYALVDVAAQAGEVKGSRVDGCIAAVEVAFERHAAFSVQLRRT